MTQIELSLRGGDVVTFEAASGVTLMEAIRDRGVDELLALCGGCRSCATCHVYVMEADEGGLPPMTDDENDLLDNSSHRQQNSRLACQLALADTLARLKVIIAPED